MSALYMIIGTLIALGVLVTFHEYGHFWVARHCGVKVLRFSVGFGKPLVRWHDRQGTEFVIAAIPLGGYVKMLDEREAPVAPELLQQAFNRKTVRQRFAIVSAGPAANFLLALLFFWLIAMLGSEQIRPVVGAVQPDSLAAQAGIEPGQEIISIDGEPTAGWSAVNLQLVRRLGETGTLTLELQEEGGASRSVSVPLRQWLQSVEEPDPIAALGIRPWRPEVPAVVAELEPGGPAEQAGITVGDKLLRVDGVPITQWSDLVEAVRARPGNLVALQYERGGETREIEVTLGSREQQGEQFGFLGAGVKGVQWPDGMTRTISYDPLSAVARSFERTWEMSLLTLDSLKKMLLGELSVKNLSGPITIAKVAGASAQSGLGDFLNFLAYLSISLGVLNLLPIPVLDGGHLLFYMIEWVRGRPLSERVQGWGMQIGISLVVGVMLLALVNDLGRL
ncbi:sigma E protease regulator RseP [Stutzerimonas urumqiensis]|uniref:sigma E protease regulator RseP n=1 Tax=Stutzerimonas urumqiensis TaxID=638269 RepID=UPI003DA2DD22